MASVRTSCRLAVRAVPTVHLSRQNVRNGIPVSRAFATSSTRLAATNFTMPALSPTMTEGNIATWQVKEGSPFAAGDVLLEIETDKATMDVEAQEDGVLVKITQGDGAKSIQVGTRIAVLAERDDDVSTLELPPDEKAPEPPRAAPTSTSTSTPAPAPAPAPAVSGNGSSPSGKTHKQKYPLMPSVGQLVRQNGLDESAVGKITPTGPNGRLLKGDVLAYLGVIKPESPASVSSLLAAQSHLDLSDVKPAAAKPTKSVEEQKQQQREAAETETQTQLFSFTVSLDSVAQHQKKTSDELGYSDSVSEYIIAAARKANANLPPSPVPTADDLFDQVLGLKSDRVGSYVPAMLRSGNGGGSGSVSSSVVSSSSRNHRTDKPNVPEDIIDVLTGQGTGRRPVAAGTAAPDTVGVGSRRGITFGMTIPSGEAARASVFAKRFKTIMEEGPW